MDGGDDRKENGRFAHCVQRRGILEPPAELEKGHRNLFTIYEFTNLRMGVGDWANCDYIRQFVYSQIRQRRK
jgi:hypothetical protein